MIKALMVLCTWAFAFIPTWFFLFIKTILAPVGFWQNFIVYGVGIYVLGSAQIIFILLGIFATISIICSK